MSNIREEVQQKISEAYLNSNGKGILLISMRVGKTRCALNCCKEMDCNRVLVVYPQSKIKESWINEMEKLDYSPKNIEFSTYTSLKKLVGETYDIIIYDEVDSTSSFQREVMAEMMEDNDNIMGLTGTLNKEDREELSSLGLNVITEYGMHEAIEDGIIPPYHIHVIKVPLDNTQKIYTNSKGIKKTEKEKYNGLTYVIKRMQAEKKDFFHLSLTRARFVANAPSRLKRCQKLVKQLEGKRAIFFGGSKDFIENLGIPFYHSTSKDKTAFDQFVNQDIDKLSFVKIGGTGITYPDLDTVVIMKVEGNSSTMAQTISRVLVMDYKSKTGQVVIVMGEEDAEQKRLKEALSTFKSEFITYGS